jgi:hypothetical protein
MDDGESHDELSQLTKWISKAQLEEDWSNLGLSADEELAIAARIDRFVEHVKDLFHADEIENDSRFRSIVRRIWTDVWTMGLSAKAHEGVCEFLKSNWHDLALALSASVLSGDFSE